MRTYIYQIRKENGYCEIIEAENDKDAIRTAHYRCRMDKTKLKSIWKRKRYEWVKM